MLNMTLIALTGWSNLKTICQQRSQFGITGGMVHSKVINGASLHRAFRSGAVAHLEFDPHVPHILSWRLGHENISTAILPLLLLQEEQLSVTGERMYTKHW